MRETPSASALRSKRARRLMLAAAIYVVLAIAYLAMMPRQRLTSHTPYNHYALQAEAWLAGRLDLGGPPPRYTGNNDFALHEGKHYVSFPPVPAAILLPFVATAGGAEGVRDAQVFALLAPLGPALFFLVLERLRRSGRSRRREQDNVALAALLGLGTVYWFSAVQGSVWFAGHVAAMALMSGYLLCSLDARHPVLAGLLLGLAFGTRPSLGFALPFFLYEAYRAACDASGDGSLRAAATRSKMLRKVALFAAPAAVVLALLALHNYLRFGDPLEFGHRMLTVVWRKRIDEWGLFSFHYLGRNLAVVLAGLPFVSPDKGLQINGHGLALWLTTPVYAWALWPRRTGGLYWAAAVSAAAVALPSLLYQNTGWIQFGYRFSNDFAPLLVLMIATGGRKLRGPFWLLLAASIIINGFGALTFGKAEYRQLYFIDPTQRIVHQPD